MTGLDRVGRACVAISIEACVSLTCQPRAGAGAADVADYVLERDDASTNDQIAVAVRECTGGAFDQYWEELGQRHNGNYLDGARFSSLRMYRKIWLAHTLVHAIEAEHHALELVMRGRVDDNFVQSFDWPSLLARTNGASRIVALSHSDELYWSRSGGVPSQLTCIIDDQAAVGPPHLMDGYASVYHDMARLAPLLNLGRVDQTGHGNERILRAHLAYRNVPFVPSHSHGIRIHWGRG